jgi:hypothetical protein
MNPPMFENFIFCDIYVLYCAIVFISDYQILTAWKNLMATFLYAFYLFYLEDLRNNVVYILIVA